MIFAHFTVHTDDLDKAIACYRGRGYIVKEVHRSIPSSPAKWPLMKGKATKHDLALLDGVLPIEIVCHDTGPETYPCIAFYSTNLAKDVKELVELGCTATEEFTVELSRKMNIVMLRTPTGLIIELIKFVR